MPAQRRDCLISLKRFFLTDCCGRSLGKAPNRVEVPHKKTYQLIELNESFLPNDANYVIQVYENVDWLA